jgi:CheY-like chemotaxis protein/HPt (histidine-containing phosphotransfer) domain-containing protein
MKSRILENKRILVVEDVEMNQYLAKYLVESWGCIVQIANNGKEGLETLIEKDFDLVLMDIQMPEMDGIEATRAIRKLTDPRKAAIPIIALTANAANGDCALFLSEGMDDCLAKPYQEANLFAIMEKHLKKSKSMHMDVDPVDANNGKAIDTKSYDLSLVEAISGGDKEFVVRMVKLFVETIPTSLKELESSTASLQYDVVSKVAHKLKSTIDSMGIEEVKADIRTIEISAKKNENVEAIPALVAKVKTVVQRVIAEVQRDFSLHK